MGASYGAAATELILGDAQGLLGDGPLTPRLIRHVVSASAEYRLEGGWSVGGGAGATLGGTLELGAERHQLLPGFVVVASGSRALDDVAPYFVVIGVSAGVSSGPTRSSAGGPAGGQLTAGDLRLSVTAGRLFVDAIAPYLTLRAFGGPVFWQRDRQPLAGGTDRYHVSAGLGLLVTAPQGVDGFVELSPTGERALTAGVGVSF